ncbi:RHS repeat domain-containing protein [Maridesulfovibrio ferrireducens]|nr:RHS repeat-associated core domain-containing protein [Maridesulfovibrio ferrireducens]
MTYEGKTFYFATDQVGSIFMVADERGNEVKRIIYDSFGNLLFDSNEKVDTCVGFSAGLVDKDTGLIHFGYREYDPTIGRFITPDPIGFAGGDVDVYGFCLDDPINFVDRTGLNPIINTGLRAIRAAAPYIKKVGKSVIKAGSKLAKQVGRAGKSTKDLAKNSAKRVNTAGKKVGEKAGEVVEKTIKGSKEVSKKVSETKKAVNERISDATIKSGAAPLLHKGTEFADEYISKENPPSVKSELIERTMNYAGEQDLDVNIKSLMEGRYNRDKSRDLPSRTTVNKK